MHQKHVDFFWNIGISADKSANESFAEVCMNYTKLILGSHGESQIFQIHFS